MSFRVYLCFIVEQVFSQRGVILFGITGFMNAILSYLILNKKKNFKDQCMGSSGESHTLKSYHFAQN